MPSDAPTNATTDAPGDAAELDFRQLLEIEQRQLQSELSELGFGEKGGLDYDPNFADSSQVTAERGEAETLAGQLKESLDEIDQALARLENGTYGRCEVCGVAIQPARLEAMPASRFCIDHANRS